MYICIYEPALWTLYYIVLNECNQQLIQKSEKDKQTKFISAAYFSDKTSQCFTKDIKIIRTESNQQTKLRKGILKSCKQAFKRPKPTEEKLFSSVLIALDITK